MMKKVWIWEWLTFYYDLKFPRNPTQGMHLQRWEDAFSHIDIPWEIRSTKHTYSIISVVKFHPFISLLKCNNVTNNIANVLLSLIFSEKMFNMLTFSYIMCHCRDFWIMIFTLPLYYNLADNFSILNTKTMRFITG